MNLDINQLLSIEKLANLPFPLKLAISLGVIVITTILVAVLSVFVITKAPEKLASLKQSEENELATLKRLQKTQLDAETYQQAIDKAENLLSEISMKLPAGINASSFLQQLTTNAQQNGIVVLSSKANKEQKQNFIDEIPITISGCATYHQLGNFVANLSTLERIITLKRFSMIKSEIYRDKNLSTLAVTRAPLGEASSYGEICEKRGSLPFTASISTYRYREK